MATLKHTEYKIICDGCYCNLTDYYVARTAREAIKHLEKKHGQKFKAGESFCEQCKDEQTKKIIPANNLDIITESEYPGTNILITEQ